MTDISPADSSARDVTKEMGITPVDFVRLFPRAVPGWDFQIASQSQKEARIRVGTAARGATITITALPERRITALMVLPRSHVTMAFAGLDAAEQADFLRLFDRAYQRGGG